MAGERFAVLNITTGNLEIKADGATIAISTLNLSNVLTLTYGGTGSNLTASTGGIVYSGAVALAILSGTVTANKVLMSASSAAPVWSTPTFPNASVTAGKIIRSDGTNWIASTPTFPNIATSGKILKGDGTNWIEGDEIVEAVFNQYIPGNHTNISDVDEEQVWTQTLTNVSYANKIVRVFYYKDSATGGGDIYTVRMKLISTDTTTFTQILGTANERGARNTNIGYRTLDASGNLTVTLTLQGNGGGNMPAVSNQILIVDIV